jgi:hypothetical protein
VAHTQYSIAATGTSTSSAINCTGASLIVAYSTCYINGGGTTENTPVTSGAGAGTFQDSSNNTYTGTTRQATSTNNETGQIYYVTNPTVTSSMTWTGGACASGFGGEMTIGCYSGIKTASNPLDGAAVCASASATNVSASYTPAQSGVLFVSSGLAYNNGQPSINSGWTISDSSAGGASDAGANLAYQGPVSGAHTATWTWSFSAGLAACIVAFDPPSGGSTRIHHKVSSQ